ncbi:sensor histidine kinase [Lunatibacter salilacus]|uniref:sensor histidine kinase n=1 Tax=Lunatibacter salilacus TaxID=2483804 RepID=UPI00131C1B19|nr:ATP-binding protein [Lunatibacter salilacus]
MQSDSIELFFVLLSGIFLMFMMSGFIVAIVVVHRQRQVKNKHRIELMKADYEKTLLNVEKEIREETLLYVSQELHDNIGQMLSLTKLVLANPEPSAVLEGKKLINQIIKEVRSLSKSINRDYLKDIKFGDFLSEELEKIERSGFCQTALIPADSSVEISDDNKKLILIRVVQECLNNAIKHASPTWIKIQINHTAPLLELSINDDGVGFDTQQYSQGLGLRNLQSRMNAIDGDISFQSELQKGTQIKISLTV